MPVINEYALLTILLVYVRIFSFLFLVPFFGKESIPNIIKVYLTTAVSLSIFLYIDAQPLEVRSSLEFFTLALGEFLLGFVSGLILRFLLDAVMYAGELIGVNMGLGLATVFLPQQPQANVMSVFFMFLGSLFFIAVGGPEILYIALIKSFEKIPIGSFGVYSFNPDMFLKFFYESFNLAFRVALPVILTLLILNIVLAITNRFIPQINVFVIGLPLQVFVGFVVLIVVLPVTTLVLSSYIKNYIIKLVDILGN